MAGVDNVGVLVYIERDIPRCNMNLTMQKLNCDSSLYKWAEDLVKQSFPLCERRDDDVQRQTLAHPDYHF